MPVFRYEALNSAGKNVKGQIDAESARQAKDKLKADKLFPTDIVELKGGQAAAAAADSSLGDRLLASLNGLFSGRVSVRELSMLTRQLAVLLRAGIPLVESLTALIEQIEQERLQQILSQIRDHVNEGGSLADGLAQHPGVFSNLYVNMVRAGESSGMLEVVLMRLADFLENQAALRQKITSAMAYPIVIMLVMAGAVIFLVYFVIPNMLKVFEQTEMELPIYTRILIGFVNLMQNYWWALALGAGGLVAGIQRLLATEKGKRKKDEWLLQIPGIRRIVMYISVARFSRTLGTLLKSGVSMLVSLRIVRAVISNEIIKDVIADTEEAVTEGASLAQPLKASKMFPPTVIHMVAAGEKSGELEDMLLQIAETYEGQVESYTVILTSALEPMIIILMTLMVGFVLVSVLLPMMQMNNVF